MEKCIFVKHESERFLWQSYDSSLKTLSVNPWTSQEHLLPRRYSAYIILRIVSRLPPHNNTLALYGKSIKHLSRPPPPRHLQYLLQLNHLPIADILLSLFQPTPLTYLHYFLHCVPWISEGLSLWHVRSIKWKLIAILLTLTFNAVCKASWPCILGSH